MTSSNYVESVSSETIKAKIAALEKQTTTQLANNKYNYPPYWQDPVDSGTTTTTKQRSRKCNLYSHSSVFWDVLWCSLQHHQKDLEM